MVLVVLGLKLVFSGAMGLAMDPICAALNLRQLRAWLLGLEEDGGLQAGAVQRRAGRSFYDWA